jgi:hypothetical protein
MRGLPFAVLAHPLRRAQNNLTDGLGPVGRGFC